MSRLALNNYYIRGPILEGKKFIIVSSNSKKYEIIDSRLENITNVSKYPYFLRYSEKLNAYVFDPRLAQSNPISYFEVSSVKTELLNKEYTNDNIRTVGEIVIRDISAEKKYYLSVNSEGFLTRIENKCVFKLGANINPWKISPLLAGVNYFLIDKSNRKVKIYKILPDLDIIDCPLSSPIPIINLSNRHEETCSVEEKIYDDYHAYQTEFRLVPFKLFKRSVNNKTLLVKCKLFINKCKTDEERALKLRSLESNWILHNFNGFTNLPNNPHLFTNKIDCYNGNWYNYCRENFTCGTNISDKNIIIKYYDYTDFNGSGRGTCRGPCPNDSDFCDYNTKSGIYECEDTNTLQKQTFLFIIFIVILLFAIFLIVSFSLAV